MSSSARGSRVIKAVEYYVKNKPNQFDSGNILSKLDIHSLFEGRLRSSFTVDSSMCNSLDTLHGGFISSAIDVAAVWAQLGNSDGKATWSTSMQVNFLRSASKGDKIILETMPLRSGSYPVMEAILRSDQDHLIIAQGTVCLQTGNDVMQKTVGDVINFDVFAGDS